MLSKESTKYVTVKLNFQTNTSQNVVNKSQEINIHRLSLEKTHTCLPKGIHAQQK